MIHKIFVRIELMHEQLLFIVEFISRHKLREKKPPKTLRNDTRHLVNDERYQEIMKRLC